MVREDEAEELEVKEVASAVAYTETTVSVDAHQRVG